MECSTNQYVAPDQRLRICDAVISAGGIPPHNLAVAFETRGKVYLDKSDYDRAIADFDQAIKLDPEFVEFLNDRGLGFYKMGQYDRAIADFDQALKLRRSFITLSNRGLAYQAKGEYERAIQDYDDAITIVPSYADALNNRGDAYRSKGELDRAIADYDRAIALRPGHAGAIASRRLAYQSKGQTGANLESVSPLKAAGDPTDSRPTGRATAPLPAWPSQDAFSLYNQGRTFLSQKDYDRAIAQFDEAIKLDPKYILAFNARGLAYAGKSRHDDAIADYDRAIALDPDYAAGYLNRANAYRSKGRDDRAIVDFDRAIELSPRNAAAYFGRAMAYQDKAARIASLRMLPDKLTARAGTCAPNRIGVADGGTDQHGCAARGGFGGGGTLSVGGAGGERADTRRTVQSDRLASQARGARARRPINDDRS
jgi:tetratricopeptide (TPR) repeat protein